ncbi:hypothetical protein ACWC9T_15875 [Kitasatospora sp. NPDC001159]
MNVDQAASTAPADATRSLQLGPPLRTDEHRMIGDRTRKAHLALLPEGVEHRAVGASCCCPPPASTTRNSWVTTSG